MNQVPNQINSSHSSQIIDEILQEAYELHTPIIRDDAIQFMIRIIRESDIKEVLEIGAAIGYSAIMIATYTDANVRTIERDEDSYLRAKKNIHKAGLDSRITIVHADALEYQIEEDYQCDLLFIDAAKAQYIKFFERYTKYLTKEGIVMADNLLFHGLVNNEELIETKNQAKLVRKIKAFNEYLMQHPDYVTTIHEIGDGLSVSKRIR